MPLSGSSAPSRSSRRAFLLSTAATFSAPAILRAAPGRLATLALFGPPAGPSITLAHAIATRAFADLADKVTLKVWRNPDEMRAGLTSGSMEVLVMPTASAANLYNRGLGVRLASVMTNGLLYVAAADPAPQGVPSLMGRTLAVPFPNDTPAFILDRLLALHGLVPGRDLTIDATGSPIEAIQKLLAGRIDAAMVPEPAVSAAIFRGSLAGKTLHRAIDVQRAWADITGTGLALPQAGLAVTETFRSRHADLIDPLCDVLESAAAEVNADPARAASHAAAALELPWPILKDAIPFSNLVATRASVARPALESLYTSLVAADPAILGGKLPDAAFYL